MLIDEILRALRDPEYRAQLTREVGAALPDRHTYPVEVAEHDGEAAAES